MFEPARHGRAVRRHSGLLLLALAPLLFTGCSRFHYQREADRDAYGVLREKTWDLPWHLPSRYSVVADPRSRLYDPSNPVDPALPWPGPELYGYQLPQLREPVESAGPQPEPVPRPPAETELGALHAAAMSPTGATIARLATHLPPAPPCGPRAQLASWQPPMLEPNGAMNPLVPYADTEEGLTIQPIPAAYWEALPQACLSRMLEFQSVRDEYRRTYNTDPPPELLDDAPKLTFDNIVELAYLNSRDYQTQKEILYSAALALTLERFDYMTKFTVGGNGVDANFDHLRTSGITVNSLSTPSSLQTDRMTALGGTIVTRFANNVLLTFNGPDGFAEDISSNMLFEFTQSVFQRDVLLEPLIQSERNVVYAARDFARFRKQFFFNLANTYYQDLLSTYRGIEIDTQNYFAFVRALDQAEAEVRSGIGNAPPRFQIDQIEQNMLGGRSRLISTCNSLETSLDRLKLSLGLPTETPINIDLRELETLTRRDEIEVAGELIRRARERLVTQLATEIADREEILSSAIVLLERILEWLQLRERITQETGDYAELGVLRARLRVDEAYEAVDRMERQLALTRQPPAVPIDVYRGTMNAAQARLELVARMLQLADELGQMGGDRDAVLAAFVELSERIDAVRARLARFLEGEQEDLNALQLAAEAILQELEALDVPARRMVQEADARADADTELQQTTQQAQQLLETTDRLSSQYQGLAPVDLSVDDAMVTALIQRFELMNERGLLADDWRFVKLAADDLKSVLNLNVRQSFTTRKNRPFALDFDDSRTELRASFDLPLNRRQQRNSFRRSLISYQAARRSLMALEDNIKFAARQDLRTLDLDRVQYQISVVSAALASERVYSTQLELALGLATVTARDFLEAQRDYRASLSSVANGRLGYIVNRAQLALDLELMILDDNGYWPELTNEEYQPAYDPNFPWLHNPTYGDLPPNVLPSPLIRRLLHAPPPSSAAAEDGRPNDE